MSKYAIYTAIVGGYDEILQPKVIDDRFDYILFSNDIKETNVGVWQVRPINYHNDIQTKIARWVKTHPEELLSDYDLSVWMDANIRIETGYIYGKIIQLFEEKVLLCSVIHPVRNCAYAEVASVVYYDFEDYNTSISYGKYLLANGYPRCMGLNETNILYRIHSDLKVFEMDNLWWNCIDNYSRRDQLSFNYSCWQVGISCENLLPIGESARNSKNFTLNVVHKNETKKHIHNKRNKIKLIYNSCHDWDLVGDTIYWALGKKNTSFWLAMIAFVWGAKNMMRKFVKWLLPTSLVSKFRRGKNE